eukprot:TRINITY_DN48207_c0_g1_i1.p1 TRINITY_DN48207_c0_g1~~TRINITY_DN48207_c0_g1_i1.p1  ORF type:complete len:748 (+),score=83.34 TRINITY_DN48207_c0_g1_i1:62-2305(+)
MPNSGVSSSRSTLPISSPAVAAKFKILRQAGQPPTRELASSDASTRCTTTSTLACGGGGLIDAARRATTAGAPVGSAPIGGRVVRARIPSGDDQTLPPKQDNGYTRRNLCASQDLSSPRSHDLKSPLVLRGTTRLASTQTCRNSNADLPTRHSTDLPFSHPTEPWGGMPNRSLRSVASTGTCGALHDEKTAFGVRPTTSAGPQQTWTPSGRLDSVSHVRAEPISPASPISMTRQPRLRAEMQCHLADVSTPTTPHVVHPVSPRPLNLHRPQPLVSLQVSPEQETRSLGSIFLPISSPVPANGPSRSPVSLQRIITKPPLLTSSALQTFANSAHDPNTGNFLEKPMDQFEPTTPTTVAGESTAPTPLSGCSALPRTPASGGGLNIGANIGRISTVASTDRPFETTASPSPLVSSPRRFPQDGGASLLGCEQSGDGATRAEAEKRFHIASPRPRSASVNDIISFASSQHCFHRECDGARGAENGRESTSPLRLRSPSPRRRSGSPGSPRSNSPSPGFSRIPVRTLKNMLLGHATHEEVKDLATGLFFEELPPENVADLKVAPLDNEQSREDFLDTLFAEGGRWSRVRTTWHLTSSVQAAGAIAREGICCDADHCACGRYGRGGYVACSAAKANAYADSTGESGRRALLLVLALPDEDFIVGERGSRPPRTAADHHSHPTEFCFVDSTRLHCACLLSYSWVPTGRRGKLARARDRMSHIVKGKLSVPPCRSPPPLTIAQTGLSRRSVHHS